MAVPLRDRMLKTSSTPKAWVLNWSQMRAEGKGYNALYKDAIARGMTPEQAASIAQTTYVDPIPNGKTSTATGSDWLGSGPVKQGPNKIVPTNKNPVNDVPVDNWAQFQSDFDKSWNDYIKASQDAYGIETGRTMDQFGNNAYDIGVKQRRNAEDYAKFTGAEQADFNQSMALRDKDFAQKMGQAANAYGQRGLLWSGVMKKGADVALGEQTDQNTYLKTQSQRRLDTAATSFNRNATDYQLGLDRNNIQQGQYAGDRAAGSKILGMGLQSQGDAVYNASTANTYKLQQDQARQDALNKMYGIKSNPTRVPQRFGGTYYN